MKPRSDLFNDLLSGVFTPPRPEQPVSLHDEFLNALKKQVNDNEPQYVKDFILGIAKEIFTQNNPTSIPRGPELQAELNSTIIAAQAVALHIEMLELRREFENLVDKCLWSTGSELADNKAKLQLNLEKQYRLEPNLTHKKHLENQLEMPAIDDLLRLRREHNQLIDNCINGSKDDLENNLAKLQQNINKLSKLEPNPAFKKRLDNFKKSPLALDEYIQERRQNKELFKLDPKKTNENNINAPAPTNINDQESDADKTSEALYNTANQHQTTGFMKVVTVILGNYNGYVVQNTQNKMNAVYEENEEPIERQKAQQEETYKHKHTPLGNPLKTTLTRDGSEN